tara:strand:+ start:65 stop:1807 length:1743 start_codon:yes stop_codon:yes gene_type:complete
MSCDVERGIDAIEVEVFSNRILAIIEEMGAKLVRSSFSPNIKERQDCSVALFDAKGRAIGQAAHIPIHLGSLKGGVDAVLRDFDLDDIEEGDAFICNDAYLAGGTHLPDISIITPVFYSNGLRCFVACVGHHADVGGSVPGSISPSATSIFEEGIRIPPIKIVRRGILQEDIIRLVINNTREPEDRSLDLKVQVATNDFGVIQTKKLIEKMGLEAMEIAVEDLLIYTSRRLKKHLLALRQGSSSFTTWMDDDGLEGQTVPLTANVKIENGHLLIDFSGSGPQSRGAFNVMTTGVIATVSYAVKALLDPDLPANDGLYSVIQLKMPRGSIINPVYPAAVGARTTTCQKLAGAIFGAFAQLLEKEQIMASSHDVLAGMVFSGLSKQGDRSYVYLETIAGGNGAHSKMDGMDGAHCHITNSLNMPVEAVEHEYPLMVEEYCLINGSSGSGRMRGGMGVAREVRALSDDTTFSGRADSFITAAEGYDGGLPGSHCRIIRNYGSQNEMVMAPKQRLISLAAGERVRMETPGGGGLGDPSGRSIDDLAIDLEDQRISVARARLDYGNELTEKALKMISKSYPEWDF